MKKRLFASILLCGSLAVSAFDADKSVLQKAWHRIAGIEGFNIENADPSMFNFPDGFKKGQLAIFPNASVKEEVTAILDGISEDFLLGEVSDDSFDERVFVEPAGENNNVLLYTVVGSGGADAMAFITYVTDDQADEVASLWDSHVDEEEAGSEEFDQDFGDE